MKKVFCLLLALLALGTCALAETVNATDEAVLNIFTWEGYIDYSTVIKPFEEETGIKINYATFSSNEEMFEKLSAANGGDYDIVLASDYMINAAREAGLMQKLDKSIITNYDNLDMTFMGQFFDPDNEYVVPYVAGAPLIVYDPSAVDIEITGLESLWDPALADSIGLIDDARVTLGMVLLSMGESMNTTDEAVLAAAAEKLRCAGAPTFTCWSMRTCTTIALPATCPSSIRSRRLPHWRLRATRICRSPSPRARWALAWTPALFR